MEFMQNRRSNNGFIKWLDMLLNAEIVQVNANNQCSKAVLTSDYTVTKKNGWCWATVQDKEGDSIVCERLSPIRRYECNHHVWNTTCNVSLAGIIRQYGLRICCGRSDVNNSGVCEMVLGTPIVH